MVASYIVAKSLKISTEISMFIAAVVGGLSGGVGIPARHIVEGAFTYFDIILIFVTATIFMNILKESGGIAFVVRGIIQKFHRRKSILFMLIAFLLLLPGEKRSRCTFRVHLGRSRRYYHPNTPNAPNVFSRLSCPDRERPRLSEVHEGLSDIIQPGSEFPRILSFRCRPRLASGKRR